MKTTYLRRNTLQTIQAFFLCCWFPILLNAQLSASITPVHVACFGAATGQATANPSGGTPPYTFLWNSGAVTSTIQNLTAGNYSVTVTDSAQNTAVASAPILQPTQLGVTAGGQSQLCDIAPDGFVFAVPYNATPPYSYLWSNGATTAQVNNLTGGTYTATVTDANGCTQSASMTINFWNDGIFVHPVINNTACGYENGAILLDYLSGTPPYQFQWSTGDSTQNVDNLAAGTYFLTVSDSHGCSSINDFDVATTVLSQLVVLYTEPLCLNQPAIFTGDIPPQYPQIQWSLNDPSDQITQGQGSDSIQVQWTSPGSKTVILQYGINDIFCGAIRHELEVAVCADAGEAPLDGIKISPNPFSAFLQIEVPAGTQEEIEAVLSDVSGKILMRQTLRAGSITLPATIIPGGLYFFRIKSDGAEKVWKLTKQ